MTFLLIIEKIAAKNADSNPTRMPVLNWISKWNINNIPNKLNAPSNKFFHSIFLDEIIGSNKEVNKLVQEKHTSAIDTLANLILA